MLLGDLGADVVKVERPEAATTPGVGAAVDAEGRATYFESVNRNKRCSRSTCGPWDAEPRGRWSCRPTSSSRTSSPGTMERFGLGYAVLAAKHPGLVWCSVTGFGDSQVGRTLPGYDLLVQASGGLMSLTGPEPGQPTKVGVALVDVITGLHVADRCPCRPATSRPDGGGAARRRDVAVQPALRPGQPGRRVRRCRSCPRHPGQRASVDRAVPGLRDRRPADGSRGRQRRSVRRAGNGFGHPDCRTTRGSHQPCAGRSSSRAQRDPCSLLRARGVESGGR